MPESSTYRPLDGLVDLACRDGVDIRPTLLRILTDLYVQKPAHTTEEQTQYTELALGLIATVDSSTRAIVAARLQSYSAAPSIVLQKLAQAEAPQEGTAHTQIEALFRRELTTDDLIELFFAASPDERQLILANLYIVADTAQRRLPDIGNTAALLEKAALQGDPNEFIRLIERSLHVSKSLAERIVNDASGEPLVVVAKAIDMKAAALQRILIVLNPKIGRSVTRVFYLAEMFEQLPAYVAVHLVSTWRRPNRYRQPAHEPLHWNDEHRGIRSTPSPSSQRPTERNLPSKRTEPGSR